eukprot:TRINITY_DN36999_c0_g1_i1.p1 TRINITY_DN36999_c0_g1~~TRINITY_DN36999_c0_g1_i1.p1  ORF type:complete len:154 (+),score=32.60 TRINITY_DN36999_c0_g1_i1:50-511(+)
MSDCWAWGVQQRLSSSSCAPLVTAYVRCCKDAGLTATQDARPPLKSLDSQEEPCSAQLLSLARCVPEALIGGQGRPFEVCERDFKAVAKLEAEGFDANSPALRKGWACVWKAFQKPIEQLLAQTQAVGECRPAVPVSNTGGKGAWTAAPKSQK